MIEEENIAIETLKEVASDDFDTLGDDISPKMAQNILNVISNQQKEIEEKNITINKMSKDISRQLEEIDEKSTIIMAGAEKVKQLEKEIGEYKEHYENMKWYYDNQKDNLIHKDKIREKIKELEEQFKKYENEGLSGFVSKIDKGTRIEVLKELLEEN